MSEIIAWSAVETVRQLKSGDVSAVEVTSAHLARMAQVNPALNAIVQEVPDALAQARAIDEGKIAAGILHGAPITTKINIDQKGMANSNGLPGLADNIAPDDSAVIANLRRAGGVVIGRTNTPEMSLRWCTSNPLHGITRNPWDPTKTPGGSSGGAAAAVAAGMGVLAQGNDLGGSVRHPAYCCGIVGLRPSLGRVANFNPTMPQGRPPIVSAMSVQGPLARDIADLRLGLAAMRGFDARDPLWNGAVASGRKKTGRLGLADDLFAANQHADVKDAMARAGAAAQAAGLKIDPVTLPQPERCGDLWGQLLFTEMSLVNGDAIRELGSDALNHWVDCFLSRFGAMDLAGYISGMSERAVLQRHWADMFTHYDAVIMPTSLIPPFENDLDFNAPDQAEYLIDAQRPLCIINLLGLPSVALPTHVAQGVPLGVQIAGPMHDDDAVLDIAAQIEGELGSVLRQIPAEFRL